MTVGKNLKVADFNLFWDVEDFCVTHCFTDLPFRWMAPEALTDLIYSEKSDV